MGRNPNSMKIFYERYSTYWNFLGLWKFWIYDFYWNLWGTNLFTNLSSDGHFGGLIGGNLTTDLPFDFVVILGDFFLPNLLDLCSSFVMCFADRMARSCKNQKLKAQIGVENLLNRNYEKNCQKCKKLAKYIQTCLKLAII